MYTKNFQESFDIINDLLQEKGFSPLTENEARIDWSIVGGEDVHELETMVKDFASEAASERCAEKNAWRYQH